MKRWVICLAVISLMVGATVFSACQKNSSTDASALTPSQVVDSFYQACKSKSYDQAKTYLSPASIAYFNAQEQRDPEKGFRAFADYCATSFDVPEFVSLRTANEKVTNNSAQVDTAFVYRDLDANFVPHYLVRDDRWRIDAVSTLE